MKAQHVKASTKGDIGAPLQGRLSRVLVKAGDEIKKNAPLYIIEAMKMESIVSSPFEGIVGRIVLNEGTVVEQEDLVLTVEEAKLPEPNIEEYLFVYGTLRKEAGNELHKFIQKNSEYMGLAHAQGKLFMIEDEGYPAFVTTDNQADKTIGELYKLTSPIKLLAILDEYEEFFASDNVNSVFIRNTIDVNFKGQKVESYAYEFNRSTEGLKEIVGGDFMGR